MNTSKPRLVLLLLAASLLLTGCLSPQTPGEKCTVLFEENKDLYISLRSCTIDRFDEISVTVGVPKGQRISSVNYPRYSVSARTGSSPNFDYYTVTLYQLRYSTVIRFTTAEAYTTAYHPGDGTGQTITVQEESPHLYFNTLPYRQQFSREGYLPIGWNTAPDGTGTPVGFGSRIDHTNVSHLDLYMQWLPCTPAEAFSYRIDNGQVTIIAYHGSGDVIIPEQLGGMPVTGIARGAFGDLNVGTLALPATLTTVEAGAFGYVTADKLYLFDNLDTLSEYCFAGYSIRSVHIQAIRDPVYSGSYFDTFADKMDYLDSLKDFQKMVLLNGSAARFGYDSTKLEQAFPDYRVVNMGVYAYANMLPQTELVLGAMQAGDILLSAPELDAIPQQFCGSNALDRETFCMMESNYDLFSRLDCRNYTGLFESFHVYNQERQDMPARSYLESPSDYDEDGNRQLTPTYNRQGDYILYRPGNPKGKVFGVKRAYFDPQYITDHDIAGLNRVYDAFAAKGVRVFFTYSPRSRISISDSSTPEAIRSLDTLLRSRLHATVISAPEDALMDPLYFYGTDNHLSTAGVAIYTRQVIQFLQTVLE